MSSGPFKKSFALAAAAAFCLSAAHAADPAEPQEKLLKQLRMNRLLLSQFQSQYLQLSQKETDLNAKQKDRLTDLRYVIRALEGDYQELRKLLSRQNKADEFAETVPFAGEKKTPVPPTLKKDAQIELLHEEALELVAKRELKKAAEIYEKIALLAPDDDQAYLLMGHCRLLLGEYSKAETAFFNATSISHDNLREIVPFYQNILVQNPEDDTAHSNLGYAYLMVGDYPSATNAFRDALAVNPANRAAASGLAQAKLKMGL